MKVGVFDSGVGGEAVAARLRELLPRTEIITANDHTHVPYGSRPNREIIRLTNAAIKPLMAAKCDAIIIACNTATTVAIRWLRAHYPSVAIIGLEPMVKPAAKLTKTGHIAVLATPATLSSKRYAELKQSYAEGVTISEPDCRGWAEAIEHGRGDTIELESVIRLLLAQRVDTIVLACTHYHHLKPQIDALVGPDVTVLEPSEAIKNRLIDLLV